MPSKQVKDILEHIRAFHHRLSDLYADFSEHESDERLQILLKYLARHEENFNECLGEYKGGAQQGVLETWLQFSPDEQFEETLQHMELHENMTPEELIRIAMTFDRKLIEMYHELASTTSVPGVRELFENLITMEQTKDHQYAQSLRELE